MISGAAAEGLSIQFHALDGPTVFALVNPDNNGPGNDGRRWLPSIHLLSTGP
jgi:hypothetical protein